MGKKVLTLTIFIVFGVFGRELYTIFGSLPYLILYLALIRLKTFKEVEWKNLSLLVIINIINIYFAFINPSEGIFNISFITLSIFPFVYFKHSNKFRLSPYILSLLIFVIAIIKEFQLQQYGYSLHFSLDSIRNVGNIRQSSDTIGVLSVIYLILRYNNRKFSINRYYLLIDIYVVFILLRYDIKTVIFAYLLSLFYKQIITYKYYLLILLIIIGGYIVYSGYYVDIVGFFSQSENILWRLLIWADFLGQDSDLFQILIGKYSKTVEWPITELFGFKGYINPHNSYILILHYFGLIYLIIYVITLYRLFIRNGSPFNKQLFIFMFFMAFTTAVYELPYIVLTIAFFLQKEKSSYTIGPVSSSTRSRISTMLIPK